MSARWLRVVGLLGATLSACGGEDPATRPEDTSVADVTDQGDMPDSGDVADSGDASDVPDSADMADDDIFGDSSEIADDAVDTSDTRLEPLDPFLSACDQLERFPENVASETLPILVHHRPGQGDKAIEVLGHLEFAWGVLIDDGFGGGFGFKAPLSDEGLCGPDGRFDAFLWRGAESTYVDVIAENPRTAIDDWSTHMVVDAWGEFAGEMLDATVAHELNHASQAAYDWSESSAVFEMTSTFIEDLVHDDDDNYMFLLDDFQRRPEWAIDHDDGYVSFHMYGGALYLHYLYERFFPSRPGFIVELWERLASPPPGPDGDNEPDWIDAVDAMLERRRSSFIDSLIEFARWRYYVARNDDGLHLSEASLFPDSAEVNIAHRLVTGQSATLRPMMTGTSYVELTGGEVVVLRFTVASPDEVAFVVQALPGVGDDHDLVTFESGEAVVPLLSGRRVLAFTALPVSGDADPDFRDATRFSATLEVLER